MDKRKNYYLTIDTETANSMDEPLVYDIGGCVHDNKGNIYETISIVIREVFDNEELIRSAYYYNKRFRYQVALYRHKAIKVNFYEARKYILDLCKKYNIKAIIAHNARFDYRALTTTQRYLQNQNTDTLCRMAYRFGILSKWHRTLYANRNLI